MNVFNIQTKIYYGEGSLEKIKEFGLTRVCIVCDPFMVSSGLITRITQILDTCNSDYMIYSEILPDPSIDIVIKGVCEIIKYIPLTIIAFGGGSAIDAAKAMSYFYSKVVNRVKLQFIAIPTTSGTGSEVTTFSVITDSYKSIKYPLTDSALQPDIAILEPNLVLSVPTNITVDTGVDVLTHAIEAYVSKNSDDFSDAFSEKAIKMVFEYLPEACINPNNVLAREKMHNASCLAGLAFNHAGLGINHSLAHALGATFHISHGKSNAIMLPHVIEYNAGLKQKSQGFSFAQKKYANISKILGFGFSTNELGAKNLVWAVKNLIKAIDGNDSKRIIGIDESLFNEKIDLMATAALKDICTQTNPTTVTHKQLKEIYRRSFFE